MSNDQKNSSDVEAAKQGEGYGYHSFLKMAIDQSVMSPAVIAHPYPGSGTEDDPHVVNWLDNDPRNPMSFSQATKWHMTIWVAVSTMAVAFVSSAYSGGIKQTIEEFNCTQEVATLGVSLFVLGFAIGPLLWAPLSEVYGRQVLFIGTYGALTAFNAGAAGSQNIWTLLILRFFAGAFGSSPLTNAGGVIADIFPARQRGIAMSIFAVAPFLGPVLGPIVGGFVGETIGWRWIQGIEAIFTGVIWIGGSFVLAETYAPVLLKKRAAALSKHHGKVYVSHAEMNQGKVTAAGAFKVALSRPWIMLFHEPIVLLLSIYMAILYGTLYMLFGAFPIVYEEVRGWNQGIGGLAFIGVGVGMILGVAYCLYDNKRYIRCIQKSETGMAPPEARLPPALIGGVCIPIGLFWFAWTNAPGISWASSVVAGVPFGFGMVLAILAILNYLIDAYVIFAASVLAASAVLRSLFGFAFPLFTEQMYHNLGIHWASSIPAFLALMCVPMPFLFYKYGAAIRKRCKFAAKAAAFLAHMRGQMGKPPGGPPGGPQGPPQPAQQHDDGASAGTHSDNEKDAEKDAEGSTASPPS